MRAANLPDETVYPLDWNQGETVIHRGHLGLILWRITKRIPVGGPFPFRLVLVRLGATLDPLQDTNHATLQGAFIALRVWRLANLAEP